MLPVLFAHIVFCQAMSEARLRATYTTEGHLLLLQYIYSHVVSFSIVVENLLAFSVMVNGRMGTGSLCWLVFLPAS